MSRVGAIGVSPGFILMGCSRVNNRAGGEFEFEGGLLDERADVGCKEREDEQGEGFGYFFNECGETGDGLDGAFDCTHDSVAKFEDWIDLGYCVESGGTAVLGSFELLLLFFCVGGGFETVNVGGQATGVGDVAEKFFEEGGLRAGTFLLVVGGFESEVHFFDFSLREFVLRFAED